MIQPAIAQADSGIPKLHSAWHVMIIHLEPLQQYKIGFRSVATPVSKKHIPTV
jgi:hypothetical protein